MKTCKHIQFSLTSSSISLFSIFILLFMLSLLLLHLVTKITDWETKNSFRSDQLQTFQRFSLFSFLFYSFFAFPRLLLGGLGYSMYNICFWFTEHFSVSSGPKMKQIKKIKKNRTIVPQVNKYIYPFHRMVAS